MARPNQIVNLASLQPSDQTRYNQAQAMQTEGMTPIKTSSYKGVTAAPSAAEGLAKALMAYTGAKRMQELGARPSGGMPMAPTAAAPPPVMGAPGGMPMAPTTAAPPPVMGATPPRPMPMAPGAGTPPPPMGAARPGGMAGMMSKFSSAFR